MEIAEIAMKTAPSAAANPARDDEKTKLRTASATTPSHFSRCISSRALDRESRQMRQPRDRLVLWWSSDFSTAQTSSNRAMEVAKVAVNPAPSAAPDPARHDEKTKPRVASATTPGHFTRCVSSVSVR